MGNVGPVFLTAGDYVETVVFCNAPATSVLKILGTGTLSTLLNVSLTNSFGNQSGMWVTRLGS